jgi:DNA (cytosine-5)-methyltransferase 1
MNIGSLFSGAGGLDMAVEHVFGGTVVWHSEIDKAASKVLAHRYPDVPNLGDITQVDWADVPAVDILSLGFPCQDVSAAGKRAGIKQGTRSGLWSVAADAIEALQPRIVVVENVRGLLSATAHRMESDDPTVGNGAGRPVLRAAGAVLGDLADLGYDAQWATVAAGDVGAPHRRERVFIVATDTGSERHGGQQNTGMVGRLGGAEASSARERERARPFASYRDEETTSQEVDLLPTPVVTDSFGARNSTAWRSNPNHNICIGDTLTDVMWKLAAERGDMDLPTGPTRGGLLLPTPSTNDTTGARTPEQIDRMVKPFSNLNDTAVNELLSTPQARDSKGAPKDDFNNNCLPRDIIECDQAWGKYEPAVRRWEALTRPAPKPTEPGVSGLKRPRLNPAFSEWMMGWPEGWCTAPEIGITRKDQLKIVGNGVCPQQAAAALRYLVQVAAI